MESLYCIGLGVHKTTIAYCIKGVDGKLVRQGFVNSDRPWLRAWLSDLPGPWTGALEAPLFTGWIYDFLKPHNKGLRNYSN